MLRDLLYAWRRLRKTPVFTLTAVVSLGLGIGAAVTMFSAFRSVFLRSLPYREADRIVQVEKNGRRGDTGGVSLADLEFLRRNARSFEMVAWYRGFEVVALTGTGQPANLWVHSVSRDFSHCLGASHCWAGHWLTPILNPTLRPRLFCRTTRGGNIFMAIRRLLAGGFNSANNIQRPGRRSIWLSA
jgi:hypothetical protein